MQFKFTRRKFKEDSTIIKHWRENSKAIEKFQFIYNFIPHPTRKKRATLLSNKAIFVYCGIIILVTAALRIVPKFFPGVLGYASNIVVKDLLYYTNKDREGANLPDLRLNAKLTAAAELKARDMFENGYWAHVSPSGTEPWDFIIGENYDYIYAGENLAKNFSTSKEVVQAWYSSESHRSNLLSANYDEIGFAVVNGVLNGYETTVVVQMFGRPREPSMVASVYEENKVLEEEANKTTAMGQEEQKVPTAQKVITSVTSMSKPKVDVTIATKSLTLVFGGFVSSLLTLDLWYSKKMGISKFSGQTFAHLTMLLIVIVSVWFVLKPGLVL